LEGGKKTALDYARAKLADILAAPERRFTTASQDADLDRILAEARDHFNRRM